MMTTDEMLALRSAARAVSADKAPRAQISARAAARCLSGVVNLVAVQHGQDVMQRACADLATRADAWTSRTAGAVGDAVWTIAVVARGIQPLCGADAMKAALAFWASETDPAEWQRVAAGVAA